MSRTQSTLKKTGIASQTVKMQLRNTYLKTSLARVTLLLLASIDADLAS
jgi:hypothetical protein